MSNIGIVVADGARARFLTVHEPDELTVEEGSRLVERSDLVHPEGDLPARELFSDRGGRIHGSPGGSAHGSDGGHERHQQEFARRFAGRVLEAARSFVTEFRIERLLLAAEPRMLGLLRAELMHHGLTGVAVVELGEDLSGRSLSDIRSILARHALLPAARAPEMGVYHPRGQPPASR